jgi:hypothetical protein
VGDLTVWAVDDLPADDLSEVLVAADNDHRLARPAWLLVRSSTCQARSLAMVTPGGAEASAPIFPAARQPSVKHPLGRAPRDTVIGPIGAGPITYLPATRGLRVLAFTQERNDPDATT